MLTADCRVTHITQLLGLRNKSILLGDLNAKHRVWNSKVSNTSGLKLLELFVSSILEMSARSALRITDLMVDVMISTLWYIRTSDCQRSLSLASWTQITYQ
jgi:hypothetical protein